MKAIVTFLFPVFFLSDVVSSLAETSEFHIVLPHSIQCKKQQDERGVFKFEILHADFKISSKVELKDAKYQLVYNVATVAGATMGLGLPLLLIPGVSERLGDHQIGANEVNVISATMTSSRLLTQHKVRVLWNGIDQGILLTDNNGMLRVNVDNEGVYEFVTSSDKDGLTLMKEFFIEKN